MLWFWCAVSFFLLGLIGMVFIRTGWMSPRALTTAMICVAIAWIALLWFTRWDYGAPQTALILVTLMDDPPISAFDFTSYGFMVRAVAVMLCIVITILVVGVSLLAGLVRRRAAFLSVRDGLVMLGFPLALVFVVAYARATAGALALNDRTNQELARYISNGGAYCAAALHKAWPPTAPGPTGDPRLGTGSPAS